MSKLLENINIRVEPVAEQPLKGITDYADILQEYDLEYQALEHYLQVGNITWVQGWILHISVIGLEMERLLRAIIPMLSDRNIPFQISRNAEISRSILNGEFGLIILGKLVAIYPEDEVQAAELADKLILLTSSFRGPHILTDRQLSKVLYTRYGACNPIPQKNEEGIQESYIYDIEGRLVKD